MDYELSVIVPCFNEEQNILELVDRIQNVFKKKDIKGEILLVNDGSRDNTGEAINNVSKEYKNVVPLHHEKNQGIPGGWKTGLANSKGEYICIIDADLQYLPEDIWRLYRAIKNSYVDVVQGYRSYIGREKDSRYLLSKGLNIMLNFLFGMNSRDNKSGFLVCRREVFEDILNYRFDYFYFQTFISVAAKMKGYTIGEVQTLFESRFLGKSFIPQFPMMIVVKALWDIVMAFVEFRLLDKRERILEKFLLNNIPKKYVETLKIWRKWYFKLYIAFMPMHHWTITRQAADYYYELEKSQWLTLDQMHQLQEKKLRKLIHHAYYHVGYYREMFNKLNIKPQDIQTLDDLKKLPLLDKQTVRENIYFDLMSDNFDKKKILRITTSGSTGEPFICFADKHQLEIRWASTLRSMEWTGYRFGDKTARLWHQTIGMTWSQVVREKIDAWFNRRLFIPVFEMSDKNMERNINRIRKYKPVLFDGYAEALNLMAKYIKEKNLKGLSLKGVISSAQFLPDESREIIEERFGCKVFDKYGSREFSGIAYECEAHDGHHVVAENYIVEILKDGKPAKPGEVGEVVITDLNNYCMPFIRYRIGDLATAMDNNVTCKCGRGLPRIGKIEGRVQSIVLGTNGNYVLGSFFLHLFKDYDYIIRQFQVIQEEYGKIDLRIIKAKRFDEETFNKLVSELHYYLGKDMVINVEFVEHIPMVRTGKQQVSISKIGIDFQKVKNKN
ncbi:MAG: glycosyltransferase [Endomicrobiales bacterium]|nr:glycosyltransferase [Endomicrobiales bacterium]